MGFVKRLVKGFSPVMSQVLGGNDGSRLLKWPHIRGSVMVLASQRGEVGKVRGSSPWRGHSWLGIITLAALGRGAAHLMSDVYLVWKGIAKTFVWRCVAVGAAQRLDSLPEKGLP
jgi:hypothetical protein